ncbi:MAG: hypothetical protein U9Q78_07375 [Chloroflexota bacterium]|nr:hypothetical protein [Chloroflexota bacterium]
MEKRFKILRFVATLYKIFAWIALAVGIAGMLGTIIVGIIGGSIVRQMTHGNIGGAIGGIVGGVSILVVAVLYFLLLYAIGEGVSLLLNIEENTRRTAHLLSQEREVE